MTNEEFYTNVEWLERNIEIWYQLTLASIPNIEEIDKYENMIIERMEYLYNSDLDAEQEWIYEKLEDDYIEISSYVRYNIRTS